jgi:hypothetical protein
MKNIIYYLIIFLVTAGTLYAGGGPRNGTGGAAELLIPVGPRGIAMSGSTLANSSGLEALFWNPANISRGVEYNTNVLISHMDHIADIGVEYGAVATSIESFGTIAFSIKSLSIDDIAVTTVDNPDGTGAVFSPEYLTLGLTYASMLSDRISVGLTANLVSEKIGDVSAQGVSFNIGVAYSNFANISGLSIAAVMKNVGPQMTFDGSGLYVSADPVSLGRPEQLYKVDSAPFELPSSLELGVSYQYNINEQNSFQLGGVFANNNFYGDEVKLGAEYVYNDLFFIRGGYATAYELESDFNTFGITGGVGLKYDIGGLDLKVDYAYQAVKYEGLGDNHIFSLGFGF